MSDDELRQVIGKARMFKELRRAKERVRQLERELRGEPARPEESTWVPEFLRKTSVGQASSRVPFGRRSARDLAEWTSASRGPLAEPGDRLRP
jgi:hypothetical protein